MMPHNEAEYMTATGSSLIALQKQSCVRERSIYVCHWGGKSAPLEEDHI
jgi:hypothetical protein